MAEVAPTVRAILADLAMVPEAEVTDARTLEDLGIDSMGVVEAIFAIEEAFDVQVPFNANDPRASGFDVSSVGAVIAAVEELVAARA